MSITAIIISIILEQYKFLHTARVWFINILKKYISVFADRNLITQRSIRYVYLFACLPIVIGLLALKYILIYIHPFIYFIINTIIFILCINILSWKEEAKSTKPDKEHQAFIQTFATRFFATAFWFIILPSAIGAICYLIIFLTSQMLKQQGKDSLVYNEVIDKMLFYVNLPPYLILFLFIAVAGDFEETSHYLVEQRKNFTKSFYFLENLLNEITLIAIGKSKFVESIKDSIDDDGISYTDLQKQNIINPKIIDYIIALLYRSGLIFLILIAIVSIANLIR